MNHIHHTPPLLSPFHSSHPLQKFVERYNKAKGEELYLYTGGVTVTVDGEVVTKENVQRLIVNGADVHFSITVSLHHSSLRPTHLFRAALYSFARRSLFDVGIMGAKRPSSSAITKRMRVKCDLLTIVSLRTFLIRSIILAPRNFMRA